MRQRGVGGECCNHVRLQYDIIGTVKSYPVNLEIRGQYANFLLEQLPMNMNFMVFSVLNVDYYVIHQVTIYNGCTE